MLRSFRSRRRPRYGVHLCALISALLLLLSVSLLHTRLSSSSSPHHRHRLPHSQNNNADSTTTTLLSDSDDANNNNSSSTADNIDELDTFQDQNDTIFPGFRTDEEDETQLMKNPVSASGYYVDHITGSIRRGFSTKRSIDEWDSNDYNSLGFAEDLEKSSGRAAFGSDDIPVDEDVRRKMSEVDGIEDALLLKIGGSRKVSPLRQGWGDWFDKKADFLRRDRMFKSNFEVLNPLNNPLLQDPDAVGVTGLTRGDKAMQKWLFNEFKKHPFIAKKPSRDLRMTRGDAAKIAERRIFDDKVSTESYGKRGSNGDENEGAKSNVAQELKQVGGLEDGEAKVKQRKPEELNYIYADGKRWGYFPRLHPHLSFSDFVDSFFRKGKCELRVFMVWNSPPWMYTVRHQRGLESLLFHHRDACVIVLSETIELDFFAGSFVKDGYKVAVAMPNLDELLKDTPASVFADVWSEWRKTKFYATHYSELVRLAAIYKYGGIYLDSDIIVLNPLSSLNNAVGLEGQTAGGSLNGAVMAFKKNSPFLMECLKEFYMTYDDTRLRWNGAELLTRVAHKFLSKKDKSLRQLELNLQPSYKFFPISSQDITSYFTTPATEDEKAEQDALFSKILSESLTLHFWSSSTSALIPEPGSLVARLLNHPCIHCSDIL
ncbi:uncharacterized protein At4g19900 [Mercurialis annua]|uniref:uncharacterized protein At4g19900 n=1 Tax=Mercurialis annua TaxID=3986 RepID=UPI00215DFC84|nr:uncharacterized protein At4g19900 [Mercurialis annua]